jgi:hypothetical protein
VRDGGLRLMVKIIARPHFKPTDYNVPTVSTNLRHFVTVHSKLKVKKLEKYILE